MARMSAPNSIRLPPVPDIVVVENGGFIRSCKPAPLDRSWLLKFRSLSKIASERGLVTIDSGCKSFCRPHAQLVSWSLANYLMLRGDRTYLAMTGANAYGQFDDRPEFCVAIGPAIGTPVEAGAAWMRPYRDGLALVNPASGASATVQLPAGRYRDLQGATRQEKLTLPPASGAVLVRIQD